MSNLPIELTKTGIGRLANREPFLLPDELEFSFIGNGYNLENAFITLFNGDESIHAKLTNPFKVDKKVLFGGLLNGQIKSYVGETLVKTWNILPLKLVETEKGTEIKDYLKTLENRVSDLEEDVAKLIKQHEIIK